MTSVVNLAGEPLALYPGEPNPVLVGQLEDWLALARTGATIGVVACFMHSNRSAIWGYAGIVGGYEMLGAMDCAHAYLRDVIANGPEADEKDQPVA
jgi:hypothetical protein